MNNDQPTQPLTDAELMQINYSLNEALNRCGELYLVTDAPKDMRRLLAEVDRLRSEVSGYRSAICFETTCTGCAGMLDQLAQADSTLDQLRAALTTLARNEQAACNRSLELQEENERLRAEATGTALGHLAKIERLQSQRNALVRKLGLDWGPDEFGDLDSVPTPVNTDRGGIVVNMEPPHGSSSTDNYAIGFSAGLRRGRRGY